MTGKLLEIEMKSIPVQNTDMSMKYWYHSGTNFRTCIQHYSHQAEEMDQGACSMVKKKGKQIGFPDLIITLSARLRLQTFSGPRLDCLMQVSRSPGTATARFWQSPRKKSQTRMKFQTRMKSQ